MTLFTRERGGGGGVDDHNNLHVELAAPAKVFIAVNSVLALWTALGGCDITLTACAPTSRMNTGTGTGTALKEHDD
jgi:hypothetical protein